MVEMAQKNASLKRRSACPLNASVEMLGDRWSLLIIRDMMLRGFRSYKEFLECYEGIATNILADRLRKLQAYGIIVAEPDPKDARKVAYSLTAKGISLAPVLTEMVLWAAAHEDTGNQALVQQMRADKKKFLAGVRQRWADTLTRRTKTPSADTTPARPAPRASGKVRWERSRNPH
jgi:DNA-binding HxlR family transcriptional regulator